MSKPKLTMAGKKYLEKTLKNQIQKGTHPQLGEVYSSIQFTVGNKVVYSNLTPEQLIIDQYRFNMNSMAKPSSVQWSICIMLFCVCLRDCNFYSLKVWNLHETESNWCWLAKRWGEARMETNPMPSEDASQGIAYIIKNSRSPKTDPCGTTYFTGIRLNSSFKYIKWYQPDR